MRVETWPQHQPRHARESPLARGVRVETESFGGTYRSTVDGLRIRKAPRLNGAITGSMNKGDTRHLDNWYQIANGWVWGRFTTYEGNVRYVAVGRATGFWSSDILTGSQTRGELRLQALRFGAVTF